MSSGLMCFLSALGHDGHALNATRAASAIVGTSYELGDWWEERAWVPHQADGGLACFPIEQISSPRHHCLLGLLGASKLERAIGVGLIELLAVPTDNERSSSADAW